jgi:D-serine deaminase-like pyridoxal phosphate-dependent protein
MLRVLSWSGQTRRDWSPEDAGPFDLDEENQKMAQTRRMFLTAACSVGVAAHAGLRGVAATAVDRREDDRPTTKDDIPTPALLVDLDALEFNLQKMAEQCRRTGCAFRPHAKTHKCPEIARLQIESGAVGVCVATVPEAEAMVAAGIPGVLLTSPIVEPGKVVRMVNLARKEAGVMLALGHRHEVELLSQAAGDQDVIVDVLVDVDVGDRRTGVPPGQPALELARRIDRANNLRLQGLQAYAGFASHKKGFLSRRQVSQECMAKAVETRDLFNRSGLNASILSGGSTGTYNIDSEIDGVTELQVGSYVVMDVGYRKIGGQGDDDLYADFKPSLTALTTVVSATYGDQVSVDAGGKAFAGSDRPEPTGWNGLTYDGFGDEFGRLTVQGDGKLPRLGDRLSLIVPHCDPTISLYDRIYAVRGDKIEDIWPVAARREFQPISPIG